MNIIEETVHRPAIFKEKQPHCQMDVGHSRQLRKREKKMTENLDLVGGEGYYRFRISYYS
jgi:hypothetical protein